MAPLSLVLPWHRLPPGTIHALSHLQFRLCCDPVELELRVDGSGNSTCPCWAISVFWKNIHGWWYYGGSKTGPVTAGPCNAEYHGATDLKSNSDELSALTWSMLFALQFRSSSVGIFYDSEFAAQTTTGMWKSAMQSTDA